jgi:hypothetical protein
VTVSFSGVEATVKVHWNAPDEPNGKLTNYKICWRPQDKHRQYNLTCKVVRGHVLNDKISNINKSLIYAVKILAKNRAGEGKFSKPEVFHGGNLLMGPPTLAIQNRACLAIRLLVRILKEGVQFWYNDTSTVKGGGGGGGGVRENVPLEKL